MDQAPELLLWGVPELCTPGTVAFAPERRFQLLVVLALNSGRWVERDRLAALLWPAHDHAGARRNLRKVLFNAHALVQSFNAQASARTPALEATEHAIRWNVRTDVQAFEDDLREGRAQRAPPLVGIDDPANTELSRWLVAERARLDEAWRAAAAGLLNTHGDALACQRTARRMLDVDALDETAMAALLQAEHALGRPAQAQAEYRRYARRVAEELGVEPSRALRDLAHAAPAAAAPAGEAHPATAQALPASPGFIGRRLELAEAAALLARSDCRALTVLGPGGVGKSSLAQQLIARCAATFPGGSHWVELRDVPDAPAAVAHMAQVLGVEIRDGTDAVGQIARAVGGARLLLVLDNVEHLPDLPPLLQRLLDAAPALALLLTSRERPALAAGWVLALAGLAVPDEDSRDLEAAGAFDAVRLFQQRARLAQRDFSLAAHLPAAIDIADAVAGLPLAIELAASWVRLLPPPQIAQDLRVSIDLLERDPAAPGQPARPEHASLRAVLDGSWRLLAPREREALAALSVFAGGFTRAAALAVAGCAMPLLSSLMDKSMLALDATGRLALHPVVAKFAAERLAQDTERAAVLSLRHAQHYARAVSDLAPYLRTGQRRLVDGVSAEFANARIAWRRAVAAQRADLVLMMVRVLRMYFEASGRLQEGIDELRPALQLHEAQPQAGRAAERALAHVRQALAHLLLRSGALTEAADVAQRALEPARASGEAGAVIGCLLTLGGCQWSQGQPRAAHGHYRHALVLARAARDRHAIAASLGNLGIAEKLLGKHRRALDCYVQALAIERELGNHVATAVHLNNIAALHRSLHQWPEALQRLHDGIAHCAAHGVPQMVPYFELGLGLVHVENARPAEAARHLTQALSGSQAFGLMQIELSAELGLARTAIARSDLSDARPRLRRVAIAARARQFNGLLVDAAFHFALLQSALGAPQRAADILALCLAHPAADAASRERSQRSLAALGLTSPQRRAAAGSAPGFDAVIDALIDERGAAAAPGHA